ncbi:hypothetical protein MicloDRAFT_00023300 [Microvirga lotononidis]|uniref:Uncharacterized protein n=1 Tax=Microvirga lotononidis TaxID=864069 RepID=I4YXJ4_9HYPH|nr:hypothetical protein MicloDRAFT_00023300 [Microvirga lotononidis]
MEETGKRHPANDALAYLMNMIALAFSVSCLWVVASAAKM